MRTLHIHDNIRLNDNGELALDEPALLISRLQAYLVWPEEQATRTKYLAARSAKMVEAGLEYYDAIEQEVLEGPKPESEEEARRHKRMRWLFGAKKLAYIEEAFRVFDGGFGPVGEAALKDDALQSEVERGMVDASLAGHRLLITAILDCHHQNQLRGGPSLGKATDLLAYIRKTCGEAGTRVPIMNAWKTHKHIAHLAAAANLIGLEIIEADPDVTSIAVPLDKIWDQTGRLLQLSQSFLEFGLNFSADRSQEPCLDAQLALRFPARIPPLALQDALPPLSDEYIDYLVTQRWAPHDPI